MTVADLIKASLRLIQVTKPTAEEQNDAMQALNLMLKDWAATRQGLFKLTRETFQTVASVGAYTIGTGGTFNTSRPNKIGVSFLRDDMVDTRIEPISDIEYAKIGLKTVEGSPCRLYYEKGYPLGTIFLFPVPDKVYDLFLYQQKPLAEYTSLSDSVNLPPEYESAIKFNLAVDLAPEYGTSAQEEVAARAILTLKTLKRANASPVPRITTSAFAHGQGWGSSGITDGNQYILDEFHFPIG